MDDYSLSLIPQLSQPARTSSRATANLTLQHASTANLTLQHASTRSISSGMYAIPPIVVDDFDRPDRSSSLFSAYFSSNGNFTY